ncbi:MAG: PLP-dependent aminotransferase family protein [Desulfobacterales bacterium]|nr:PLP-dependent aminotransferase family protein [Desulfobacterales bacterium]
MVNIKTAQTDIPEGVIDLGVGQPSLSLLPVDAMKQAAAHRLSKDDSSLLLQYGAVQGDGYFRIELAKFLSEKYDMPVEPDHLFITCGASQGLDLICNLFTNPGDTVFVEEPTYFLAPRIFADYRLNIIGLPVDENGLIIEALEEMLIKHKPAFLYTIPVFQNPSGVTLSPERRKQLASLGHKNNFFIIADEVYHLLSYTDAPPQPMTCYDEAGTVFSIGSFSKIMAPGLRLGWLHAKPSMFSQLKKRGMLDSGGGLNPLTSGLVRSAIELGLLDNHLDHLKKVYQQRMSVLIAALRRHMPDCTDFTEPAGGFFIWAGLPEEYDAMSLLSKAKQHDTGFQPGIRFSSQEGMKNYVRLSFSYFEEPEIEQGIIRLARALNSL